MSLFIITAWCDRRFYAQFEVEAETPERALEMARDLADDEPTEDCGGESEWTEFLVADGQGTVLLRHVEADLRDAAHRLLAALEAGRSKSWVCNAAITQDIEALRRIALEQADWWNKTAWPLIEKLKGDIT